MRETVVSTSQLRISHVFHYAKMLTTFASYRLISSDLPRSLERVAQKPVNSREADYYLENIGDIKSIDDFLANDRVFSFAMKAFGLGDMTYAKALIRKALTEGVDSETAFANKLSDPRYKDFVSTFNFQRYGEATTVFSATQQGTVDKFMRQSLEEEAGSSNEGVRLALYFERKAPAITSVYGLMGDKALLQVVQTALGIPPAAGRASIEAQAKMISERFDIADLKDPEKLKDFTTRFAGMWEMKNPSTSAVTPAVLIGQPVEMGISTNLLMGLQNLRLGGS